MERKRANCVINPPSPGVIDSKRLKVGSSELIAKKEKASVIIEKILAKFV
jgi:hypothetical protein